MHCFVLYHGIWFHWVLHCLALLKFYLNCLIVSKFSKHLYSMCFPVVGLIINLNFWLAWHHILLHLGKMAKWVGKLLHDYLHKIIMPLMKSRLKPKRKEDLMNMSIQTKPLENIEIFSFHFWTKQKLSYLINNSHIFHI